MNPTPREGYLSLEADYLGILDAELRGLRGISTLANEMLQNADDARATTICFDFQDDALVVHNDGVFSDCGAMHEKECPWTLTKQHRCDFHRFRNTAGRDKRKQEDTTGAFGIGFISVYQVTNAPELISNGRHWLIDPTQDASKRIRETEGDSTTGTTIRLPWAFDPDHPVRKALSVEPVPTNAADDFADELASSLLTSSLFLPNLMDLSIMRNGVLLVGIKREVNDHAMDISITSGGVTDVQRWNLFRADFADRARVLKAQFKSIESKKKPFVTVAIPVQSIESGQFYATLPTLHSTHLPLHINADFYPTSDRKRIVFEADYQSLWNRAAVETAAEAVATQLGRLPGCLSPDAIWEFFERANSVITQKSGGTAENLGAFWEKILPRLRNSRLVFTAQSEWVLPSEAFLMLDLLNEEPSQPLIQGLGAKFIHRTLNPYRNLLRNSEVGVKDFKSSDLATLLTEDGLGSPCAAANAPDWFKQEATLQIFAKEASVLLSRTGDHSRLRSCALIKCRDNWLRGISSIYRADGATTELFCDLDMGEVFAGLNPQELLDKVDQLRAADAIDLLEQLSAEEAVSLWQKVGERWNDLVVWFASRNAEINSIPGTAGRLKGLSIWPGGGSLHPLAELYLPGGFVDELGLAQIIDQKLSERCRDFLRGLGIKNLELRVYLIERVPGVFADRNKRVGLETVEGIWKVLREHFHRLREDSQVRSTIRSLPLIRCSDNKIRLPEKAYQASSQVTNIFGANVSYVHSSLRGEANLPILDWLGVPDVPRTGDLLSLIQKASEGSAGLPAWNTTVEHIVVFLGKAWRDDARRRTLERELAELKHLRWLPSEDANDKLFAPFELHTSFRSILFKSTGKFIGISYSAEQSSNDFLLYLGIESKPPTNLVVRHLLNLVAENSVPKDQIYEFLEQNWDDRSIAALKGEPCLRLVDAGFVSPAHAYWSSNPFGKYRYHLAPQFRKYQSLLNFLGTKDEPDFDDALSVLGEVARQNRSPKILNDEDFAVAMTCWAILAKRMSDNNQSSVYRSKIAGLKVESVIPDSSKKLRPPGVLLFSDRPWLEQRVRKEVGDELIARPADSWQAMEAAGVRRLSDVVQVRVVERDEEHEDKDLARRFLKRRRHFARVLDGQGIGQERSERLEGLQVRRVSRLVVKYFLTKYSANIPGPIEDAQAHYDAESDCLFVVAPASYPWASIARELVFVLAPEMPVGSLAQTFRNILETDDESQIGADLDELGFPSLQFYELDQATSDSISELDAEEVTDEQLQRSDSYEPRDRDGAQEYADSDSSSVGDENDRIEVDSPEVQDDETSTANLHSAPTSIAASPNSSGTNVPGHSKIKGGGGTTKRTGSKEAANRDSGRLRSYVSLGSTNEDSKGNAGIELVDRRAMERVLRHERDSGRHPVEMEHHNVGFDVKSTDGTGQVVRIIEVKGTAIGWGGRGVGLTAAQFKLANKERERYWLYVVENTGTPKERLFCINDPAGRVNQYLFDDGWIEVAETSDDLE